ncbi:pseudouridine synthase [Pseudomonas sp. UBA2684]|uniref:pseudouridine synthase n=1 Tax=Pseudomonas sp. UBA2684 TaxID=1947311 RepID=UPI000E935B0C|nr:pseudouridine synthase [Pseudomonas sp. UBA2684]HBX55515.1 16S rRNA pseudouridine(516) synthase [Pseudomonas sp.]|tara:strand:+ start:4450 stop:5142 length:693 start_codon:yes stop_codon:yes gene_type:complete
MRLDRFLSNLPQLNRQAARQLLASGRVRVDGQVSHDGHTEVRVFSQIELDEQLLQAGKAARYFMLHKPVGVVSATEHPEHRTVLDLLAEPDPADLHLAGRLDLNTSGLLLLTNDGQWSRRATAPTGEHPKVYLVDTEAPIDTAYVDVFAQGLYFRYEDLTTRPATLEILAPRHARLTLYEGRYHQVKRMFGHFQNKVIGLHRVSMGAIQLDPLLAPGQYRALTAAEIASF